ncbi:MAG: helix-turn-helix domain-containing protein [Clostridiales bacterium]|nr:helix-turn-helix domain-containing protein [Clostridiales bacterium]
MSIWNERIHERRIEKGITLAQIAEKLGVTEATAQRYECGGIKSIPYECMCAYGEILNCSPAYLMGWEDASDSFENFDNVHSLELQQLPTLENTADGELTYSEEPKQICVMAGCNIEADFGLKVSDDSMINARIHNGDIVFIKRQDTVNNGEIAAISVNNGTPATLKRYFYYVEKNMVILKAENPAYEDLIFTDSELDDFHILGKVVAFQSYVK